MKQQTISRSPDVMGGAPVFAGTRVPVQTLLDYLEAGESLDDFLDGFPTVSREQVIAFLKEAKDLLVAKASDESSRCRGTPSSSASSMGFNRGKKKLGADRHTQPGQPLPRSTSSA